MAQNPVVSARRVQNAHSGEPAPSRVPQGGILRIEGFNLGPAEGAKAQAMPLPTRIGSPEIEVMINNRAAPIFSVDPDKILVQVPFESPAGLVQVTVRRGEQRSRPAQFRVMQTLAAVATRNGLGFGEAGVREGSKLKLTVSGLGQTDPAATTGDVPGGEAKPRLPVRAFVGGLAATADVKLSGVNVGEFDVTLDIPEGAAPGDLITISLNGAVPANRPVFDRIRAPEALYTALPGGAGAQARILRGADLRGAFAIVHGNRGEDGCYPAWVVDTGRNRAASIAECLIAAQPNAASPVLAGNEQNVMAALVGPAAGDAAAGISNKVAIFNPVSAEPMIVTTPRAISTVAFLPDGSLAGIPPGAQGIANAFTINPATGEIGPAPAILGGGAAGGGGAIPGGAAGLANLTVDLGDGIKEIVYAVGAGQGTQVVVVADSGSAPTKAKIATVNNQGAVQSSVDLPSGWLPLLRPLAAAAGGGPGGGAPGGAGGGPAIVNPAAARRGVGVLNTAPLSVLLLVRNGDKHAVVSIAVPGLAMQVTEVPSGWFVSACAPQLAFSAFDTTRQFVLFGSHSLAAETANPCNANGFLVLDPAARTFQAVRFQGIANLRQQPAGNTNLNDFLFVASVGQAQPLFYDSLYVLDSLSGTVSQMAPDGLRGFTLPGQQYQVAELGALVGPGFSQAAGDGGLIYFDLENSVTSVFPVPEGFRSVALVEVFHSTRKIVALGTKTDGSGTQLLVYDLLNNDLSFVPNPQGVAFVGNLPAQAAPGGGLPGGGGQLGGGQAAPPTIYIVPNVKANTVLAMCFNANRQPVGVMTLRVP